MMPYLLPTITIAAIVLGPILAVQIQKFIERVGEKRKNKLEIYATLMATRGLGLDINHVKALNLIDLAFNPKKKKEKEVLVAWKVYMEHLYKAPQNTTDPNYTMLMDAWLKKRTELFIELLLKMSVTLGYTFDKVLIERQSYTPKAYGDNEQYNLYVQSAITDLFSGKTSLPVRIVEEQKPQTKPKVSAEQSEPKTTTPG